jgi:transcriptional regulator with XRE-family HTH domain/cation transport regulator ChaB
MPIGIDKAPKTLPSKAKNLWIDTFNGAFEGCKGDTKKCDAQAAKVAWNQVKTEYRKVGENWVSKAEYEEAYHDVLLNITKASLQPDGSVRWQAVASDTGKDRAQERTSVDLFQDWIDRITFKADVGYLPTPKMPFLGISHYPALDGYGEAGETRRMYIDGNVFKADGVFKADSAIGERLLNAVKAELALIKKGESIEKPIRISAGWWDIQHYHEDSNYLFTRQSLLDRCPLCEKGQTNDKIYKAGQLDHFAATRVPMNPRTSLDLEVKSMAKITRRDDAESIIGQEDADEMERRARMVGKSDTEEDELHPAMVVRAASKIGDFIKRKREEMEMSITDLAAKTPVTDGTIGDIERGDIPTPSKPVIAAIAKALKVSERSLLNMLPSNTEPADKVAKANVSRGGYMADMRRKKKMKMAEVAKRMKISEARLKRLEDEEDDMDDDAMATMAAALDMDDDEKEAMFAQFRKKKADTEDAEDDEDEDETPSKGKPNKEELLDRFGDKRRKAPPKKKADLDETPIEKMGYDEDHGDMPMMVPFGGATSIKEAEDYIGNQEKMAQMYSFWDMLQGAFYNIKGDMDMSSGDKVKATSNLFREMAQKVDTLKAGLSDAFLIQESAAAYDDEDYQDAEEIYYLEEEDEVNTMSNESLTPAETLQAAVDATLQNPALGRDAQAQAVNEALGTYAQTVKAQLDEANPAPLGDTIAQAIKSAMEPIAERLAILDAKVERQERPQGQIGMQEVYVPQQKSMIPVQPVQPVQPMATPDASGVPVSPVTGKPSELTAAIRKSVGLHS